MKILIDAIENNNYLKVKQAISNDLDLKQMVEFAEDEYISILFYAIKSRASLDIVRLLIEYGADLNHLTDDGVSLLDEAVIFGNLELIQYLVDELNMDIHQSKRKSGMTPFMQACCYGNMEIIKYIYNKGIDIYQKDCTGMSSFDYVKKLGKKEVEVYLNSL